MRSCHYIRNRLGRRMKTTTKSLPSSFWKLHPQMLARHQSLKEGGDMKGTEKQERRSRQAPK